MTIAKLKVKAIEICESREHGMVWEEAYYSTWAGSNIQVGICKYCRMEVLLTEKPRPNGIDLGGEALALNCTYFN